MKPPLVLDQKLPSIEPKLEVIEGVKAYLAGSTVPCDGHFDLLASAGPPERWAMAMHGGAGSIRHVQSIPLRLAAFEEILKTGTEMLQREESALDVATHVTSLLEDCPYFNAGHGSVLTSKETFEMDAGVMDGKTLYGGGCAACSKVTYNTSFEHELVKNCLV